MVEGEGVSLEDSLRWSSVAELEDHSTALNLPVNLIIQ